MADGSHIEWTDATWNPITGCSIVSPGCTHCYAMKLAGTRLKHIPSRAGLTVDSKSGPVWNGKVRLNEEWLTQPLRWSRPRMIFVCAHGDLFAENVPDEWIDRVFAVMALSPQHTFQVLTKRAKRMREYFEGRRKNFGRASDALHSMSHSFDETTDQLAADRLDYFDSAGITQRNIWLGISAERQKEADERVPELLATPAAIRFVSAEPLLGPIDFRPFGLTVHHHPDNVQSEHLQALTRAARRNLSDRAGTGTLDWIICGGESGNGARPMHPAWARQIRDDCAAAQVPFFFKQWGSNAVVYDRQRDDPDWRHCDKVACQTPRGQWLNLAGGTGFHGEEVVRVDPVGKKRAGRLLDGVEHNGMPEAREVPAL